MNKKDIHPRPLIITFYINKNYMTMETREVLQKNDRIFRKARIGVKILLVLVFAAIIWVQHENLLKLFKWIIG